jgi:hypothetical protein
VQLLFLVLPLPKTLQEEINNLPGISRRKFFIAKDFLLVGYV